MKTLLTGRRTGMFGHGMTALETDVMDRFDAGQSKQWISAATGLSKDYVDSIVGNFSEGNETRLAHADIRAASQQLGQACAAYRNRGAAA